MGVVVVVVVIIVVVIVLLLLFEIYMFFFFFRGFSWISCSLGEGIEGQILWRCFFLWGSPSSSYLDLEHRNERSNFGSGFVFKTDFFPFFSWSKHHLGINPMIFTFFQLITSKTNSKQETFAYIYFKVAIPPGSGGGEFRQRDDCEIWLWGLMLLTLHDDSPVPVSLWWLFRGGRSWCFFSPETRWWEVSQTKTLMEK